MNFPRMIRCEVWLTLVVLLCAKFVHAQECVNPAAPFPIWSVDSTSGVGQGEVGWKARTHSVDWQSYAQGEYVGHARTPHVPEYRLRVDDQIAFVFRLTREETSTPYELQVGDVVRVESLTGDTAPSASVSDNSGSGDRIFRELEVQPDGTITLPLLGQVRAARMTVDGLREHLEELYKKYYKVPAITVTPSSRSILSARRAVATIRAPC